MASKSFGEKFKDFFSRKSLLFDNWGNGGLHQNSTIINSNTWQGDQGNGMFFFNAFTNKDIDVFYGGDNINKSWYWNAYSQCPTVGSIINRKAEAFINGETKIVTRNGKGKGEESNGEAANKIRALMSKPNPLQSWAQFEAQYKIYYAVYGFCFILPIMSVGFNAPEDTKYLWIIPPGLIDISESKKIWYNQSSGKTLIDEIKLRYGNEETTLKWDELIILKDFLPSLNSMAIPNSRLMSCKRAIDVVMKGYRAMSNGFDNTPLGVLGNNTKDTNSFIPLTPAEVNELKFSLNGYGLGDGQKNIIVSNANLQWQPINYPISSLQIPEHLKIANASICDALGYPFDLLSKQEGSTYSNRQDAGKELYQNFIIPESKSIYEQWNSYFKTEELNLIIENDYSHLPILQKGDLEKSQARLSRNNALSIEFYANMLTLNQWLDKNGEPPLLSIENVDYGNMYYFQLVNLGWKFGSPGNTFNNQSNQNGTEQPGADKDKKED